MRAGLLVIGALVIAGAALAFKRDEPDFSDPPGYEDPVGLKKLVLDFRHKYPSSKNQMDQVLHLLNLAEDDPAYPSEADIDWLISSMQAYDEYRKNGGTDSFDEFTGM